MHYAFKLTGKTCGMDKKDNNSSFAFFLVSSLGHTRYQNIFCG